MITCVSAMCRDWLFVDGSDILLMVAMAFLSMFEAAILDCRDFGDVTVLFAEKPLTMYRSGALLQRARAYQDEIGTAKLSKLREAVTAQVAISGEENNKERMVRQMVKETHLTEEDISHLHEKFMELEQQARAKKAHRSRATSESGDDVHGRRQRRGSMTRLKTGLKSFKKTDLDGPAVDTIYEDREIDFDTFKQLIHSELPQWARASDDESLRKLFHAFDGDGSGTIGVNEFISGLAIFMSGDIDHKLRMIFRTTDTDGSGKVEEAEMLKLFQDCYRLFYPQMSQKHIPELVRGIFTRLEIDPDLDGGLSARCDMPYLRGVGFIFYLT
jgi:Ca2+-binding EF-hand superfamily protein